MDIAAFLAVACFRGWGYAPASEVFFADRGPSRSRTWVVPPWMCPGQSAVAPRTARNDLKLGTAGSWPVDRSERYTDWKPVVHEITGGM